MSQGTRGAALADRITALSGSWPFVWAHVVWFVGWLVFRLDINLLTLIVSLEAIFLSTFVLMSQSRGAVRSQEQSDRIEQLEQHMAKLLETDHTEHGRLLRELHSHVLCRGHTTIGDGAEAQAS